MDGYDVLPSGVEYFAWLGDDDILAPGSLAQMAEMMDAKPETTLALGRVRYITGDGCSKWVVRSGSWACWYSRIGRNFMGQPGSLMRRRAFEAVGGLDGSLKNAMDQDLFIRLSIQGPVAYVPIEVAAFRVHDGSISSRKGGNDERALVSARYRPKMPFFFDVMVSFAARIADRVLLSVHPRLPDPPAPMRCGSRYYENSAG
ncbi:GT2 family glycosyltransferase [Sinomonas atrocyanea]|nr:GT2 family glycosyltransferase [Sinomonas atrocyanea]